MPRHGLPRDTLHFGRAGQRRCKLSAGDLDGQQCREGRKHDELRTVNEVYKI